MQTRPKWHKPTTRTNWTDDKEKAQLHNRATKLYRSKRWTAVRKGYIMKHPICERCKAIGLTTQGHVLDHVIPISQGGAVWTKENWMTLCHECHNWKRGLERRSRRIEAKDEASKELIPRRRDDAYDAHNYRLYNG